MMYPEGKRCMVLWRHEPGRGFKCAKQKGAVCANSHGKRNHGAFKSQGD